MPGNRTVRQFAKEFGVHPNTVYTWIKDGSLPCFKRGKTIRIRDEDIRVFNQRWSLNVDGEADEDIGALIRSTGSGNDPYAKGLAA